MPANFLGLHIVDYCQLACRHCYLNKGNTSMPLEMIKEVSTDFLQADLPLPQSTIILSGGEPLLHPQFGEVCSIVRGLNGYVALSLIGILVLQYIDLFRRNDGIQISIDGNSRVHDFIRGAGSYETAVRALRLLDENNIRHRMPARDSAMQSAPNFWEATEMSSPAGSSTSLTIWTSDPATGRCPTGQKPRIRR